MNARDEYARFAEDARLTRLRRIKDNTVRPMKEERCKLDRPLDVPVFDFGESLLLGGDALRGAAGAMIDGTLRLPFPDCTFMYEFPADHFASLQRHGTIWIVALQQTTDEIVGDLYFRHPGRMDHYGINTAQFAVTRHDIQIADAGDCRMDEFQQEAVRKSARHRALATISHAWQLAQPRGGKAVLEPGTVFSDKVDARRVRAGLGALQPVRRIVLTDMGQPITPDAALAGRGKGIPRAPHFTRGHFRTLQTGRKVWVRDYQTGEAAPAPWYEIA